MVSRRVCRGFYVPQSFEQTGCDGARWPRLCAPRTADSTTVSAVFRCHAPELQRNSGADGGVAKALCADGYERRADVEQITSVTRTLHAAHSDHRNADAGSDGGDLRERDSANRRP